MRLGLEPALAIARFWGAFGLGRAHAPRTGGGIADVAEKVIDAVVNISTSQTVEAKRAAAVTAHRRNCRPPARPSRSSSTTSSRTGAAPAAAARAATTIAAQDQFARLGFIIDAAGVVVTNNHVIADADEINVILNDGTQDQGRARRRRQERPILAVLRFKPTKPLVAVKFGDSDKLRLGDWVVAINLQSGRHGNRRHRLGQEPRYLVRTL